MKFRRLDGVLCVLKQVWGFLEVTPVNRDTPLLRSNKLVLGVTFCFNVLRDASVEIIMYWGDKEHLIMYWGYQYVFINNSE